MNATTHELCPITGQPVYKGLPVPWIALWDGEFNAQQVMLDDVDPERVPVAVARNRLAMFSTHADGQDMTLDDIVLAYADCNYTALGTRTTDMDLVNRNVRAQRDEFGLLWHRDLPNRQGHGAPRFAGLHAGRQRVGKSGMDFTRTDPFITTTAPTCERCAPVAMAKCPAQRTMPRVLARANVTRPHEVMGDVYAPWGVERLSVAVALDDPVILRMNCKQMRVWVEDYTLERVA